MRHWSPHRPLTELLSNKTEQHDIVLLLYSTWVDLKHNSRVVLRHNYIGFQFCCCKSTSNGANFSTLMGHLELRMKHIYTFVCLLPQASGCAEARKLVLGASCRWGGGSLGEFQGGEGEQGCDSQWQKLDPRSSLSSPVHPTPFLSYTSYESGLDVWRPICGQKAYPGVSKKYLWLVFYWFPAPTPQMQHSMAALQTVVEDRTGLLMNAQTLLSKYGKE